MTTWEEIRDEIAGMLADGQPLEDVLAKLEQRKNEMAKANLIAVMDEMKKPKQMTNEEWLKSTKDTNQFACEMCELFEILCTDCKFYDKSMRIGGCTLPSWLKEVHNDG